MTMYYGPGDVTAYLIGTAEFNAPVWFRWNGSAWECEILWTTGGGGRAATRTSTRYPIPDIYGTWTPDEHCVLAEVSMS